MKFVISYLDDCRLGEKQVCRNLTVFPVLHPSVVEPYYLTLEQALASRALVVTEVNKSGNVNRLKLVNNESRPVLLIEGEELRGAKQNRIVNASFLIAGNTSTNIPVSCVEEGRWHYDSHEFSSGRKVIHASLRREVKYSLRDSLDREGGHRVDQGRVWANIAAKSRRLKVKSPTMAMSDVFDHYEDRLAVYAEAFSPVDRQVGALFAIEGTVVGLEGFGCCETLGHFFSKLINSYAMDAVESDSQDKAAPSVPPSKAKAFMASLLKANGKRHPVVSLGATVSFQSRISLGSALVDDEKVLHLSAFRKTEDLNMNPARLQRFSTRRARQAQSIERLHNTGGGPLRIIE